MSIMGAIDLLFFRPPEICSIFFIGLDLSKLLGIMCLEKSRFAFVNFTDDFTSKIKISLLLTHTCEKQKKKRKKEKFVNLKPHRVSA